MKSTAVSILVAVLLIGGAVIFVGNSKDVGDDALQTNNVSMVDGTQVITITAKGGYAPKVTTAKAGIPTLLKVATNGTFDCSSAITVPSLGYSINLPPSGMTDITMPPQESGTTLQGLCAMGMYSFSVKFN